MLHVIAAPCTGTKAAGCVDVCPVDCIHPTPDEADFDDHPQLYIDPVECIGCAACVMACPVDAIAGINDLPADWHEYVERNAAHYR